MKTTTKVLAGVIALIGMIGPAVAPALQGVISAHPLVASVVAAIAAILSLFHQPSASA